MEKKEEVELVVDIKQPSVFADNVFVEMLGDHVVFNFAQKLPNVPLQENEHGSQRQKALCASRVVLTVPHFFRFTELINNIAQDISKMEMGKEASPK